MLELMPVDEAVDFSFIEIPLELEAEPMEAQQDLSQSSVEADLSGTYQVSEVWSEDADSLLSLSEEFGDVEIGEQIDIGDPVVKPSGTSFFGLKSYGDQFVFVIDCSSSMTQNFRWERAVYELTKAIKGLEEDKEFLVLLYNSQTFIMMDVPEGEMALIPATLANKDRLYDWLDQQRPNGGTFPAHAMQVGLAFDPSAIFLLSDGEIRDHTDEILKRKNRPHRRSNGEKEKTPIHTVLLGNGFGREQMKSIAKFNNGKFRWAQ
jgi:hypothetical protein